MASKKRRMGKARHTLLSPSNQSLSNGLSNGIDLGRVTSTLNTDTNVNSRESFFAQQQDGFPKLELEDLRLDQLQRLAIDSDHSLSVCDVGDGDGCFLSHISEKQ